MKTTRRMLRGAGVMLVLVAPSVFAAPMYTGSGEDALGDVFNWPGTTPGLHDLKSALIEVDDSTFFARILFQDGTYRGRAEDDATIVSILLDLDQDKDTGFSGVDAANSNAEFFGTEVLIRLRPMAESLIRWNESGSQVPVVDVTSDVIINELLNGIEIRIARNLLLGDDDGLFNFYVTAEQRLTVNGSTGILDYLSDIGSPPLQMTLASDPKPVPEPGVISLLGLGLISMGFARRRRT